MSNQQTTSANTRRAAAVLARMTAALAFALVFLSPPATAQPQGDINSGASIFKGYCRSCHGDDARGNGPIGVHLKVPPADLTQISKNNGGTFPADEVNEKIRNGGTVKGHGSAEMPIWGEAFAIVEGGQTQAEVDQRIADLVAFLKVIQQR